MPETVFPKDCFNIVSCGRLAPAKGMDLAIAACAKLVQDGLTDIHWWIVGGGPEETSLRAQLRALGMECYVTLLGMQDNPYSYIRQANLYVQPSRFEAFGLTVLEAQVLAVPVLSTETDGSVELISNKENGWLCKPDAASIADAVAKLYRIPELRRAFRDALRSHDFEHDNALILQELYALL